MNFIILGDKYQKGMKSKGCVGLIQYDKNHNFFEHQYNFIKKYFPLANIIYVHGFESKKFISFLKKKKINDVTLVFNNKFDIKNQTYGLSLTSNYIDGDFFILFGNAILNKKNFNKFKTKAGSQVFISNNDGSIGCVINNGIVENICFDLENYICNIYYVSKQSGQMLKELVNNSQYHNSFIFEMINRLIDAGQIFKPYFMKDKNVIKN